MSGIAVIVGAIAAVGVMLGTGSPALTSAPRPSVAILDLVSLAVLAALPAVLWWLWHIDVMRPGSLQRHAARNVSASPWAVWWIGALLMLLAQGAGATIGFALADKWDPTWGQPAAALGAGLSGLAAGLWLVIMLGGAPWATKSGLALVPRARDVGVGMIAFIATVPIMAATTMASVLVAERLSGEPIDPIAHETLRVIQDSPWSLKSWGLILAAVVVAPIMEEIMFRAMVQSAFLRHLNRGWPAVLAASAIFAAVHVGAVGESYHALVPLFAFGVCLGVAYERTGRLWVPITMHAAFNSANVALTLAS